VLLGRVGVALGPRQLQGRAQSRPRIAWLDYLVDVAALGGGVRSREHFAVLARLVLAQGRRVLRPFHLSPVEDVDRALGPHDSDLGRRGGEVWGAPGGLAR